MTPFYSSTKSYVLCEISDIHDSIILHFPVSDNKKSCIFSNSGDYDDHVYKICQTTGHGNKYCDMVKPETENTPHAPARQACANEVIIS